MPPVMSLRAHHRRFAVRRSSPPYDLPFDYSELEDDSASDDDSIGFNDDIPAPEIIAAERGQTGSVQGSPTEVPSSDLEDRMFKTARRAALCHEWDAEAIEVLDAYIARLSAIGHTDTRSDQGRNEGKPNRSEGANGAVQINNRIDRSVESSSGSTHPPIKVFPTNRDVNGHHAGRVEGFNVHNVEHTGQSKFGTLPTLIANTYRPDASRTTELCNGNSLSRAPVALNEPTYNRDEEMHQPDHDFATYGESTYTQPGQRQEFAPIPMTEGAVTYRWPISFQGASSTSVPTSPQHNVCVDNVASIDPFHTFNMPKTLDTGYWTSLSIQDATLTPPTPSYASSSSPSSASTFDTMTPPQYTMPIIATHPEWQIPSNTPSTSSVMGPIHPYEDPPVRNMYETPKLQHYWTPSTLAEMTIV
ncbi:hypothetical protein BDN70DRAFT_991433 [Pholiota conissans]|uniref:Uncharacterized protein n=1 Tax=Pholiota conissans TaxID=109636 RepID=A0A9P5Z8E2_9AGAR|nr:hypothetical protein BDN70DRAFT_991433 [Pholiota conissans]